MDALSIDSGGKENVGLKVAVMNNGISALVETSESTETRNIESSVRTPLTRRKHARNVTQMGNMTVKDHFSLTNPSSTVAFADEEMIIFVSDLEQLTMEKKKENEYITAKQATIASPGLIFTRFLKAQVAFLMAGLMFVCCIQITLFLFLGVAIESGLTSQKGYSLINAFGILLSIPVFISILSQAMVLASTFVIDTWKGSKFMKTIISWDSVLIDWLSLLVFLGCPICVGSITLYTGSREWWTITCISWFVLVTLYFATFALVAVYSEIQGCLDLIRYHPKLRGTHDPDSSERTMTTYKYAIKFRMKQMLSGRKRVFYFTHGTDPHPEDLNYTDIHSKKSFQSFIGLYSRFTRQGFLSKFYTVLREPMREYTVDEALDFTPFITRSSWGLESIYFRNRSARFIAIIDGVSALTRQQVKSSLICFVFAKLVLIFAIVALLVWLKVQVIVTIVIVILYAIVIYRSVRQTSGITSVYNNILTKADGNARSINRSRTSNAMYQVQETFRITEPNCRFRRTVLVVLIILFYLVPTATFFVCRNYRVGVIFMVFGIISWFRFVFNTPSILRELGSLEGLEANKFETDGMIEWREKHRLAKIVGEISVGKRSNFWIRVFLFFVSLFCAVVVLAFANGSGEGDTEFIKFAPKEEFFYEGSKHLSYASCGLSHNIKSPDENFRNDIADFAFLSRVAYEDNNVANRALYDWFGDTVVENLSQNVTDFKEAYQGQNGVSSVSYKLFSFPDRDLQIVSIRGTSNNWDLLTDAQLWSNAVLCQVIRAILPYGTLWTPVLPHLVKVVSVIEEKSLEDVSYYKETTAFVKFLKQKGFNVQITGHSLGGGLAMITGAQTQIPAVGLSGPNSMISRKTFDPQITKEALDEYTFNIVPDRDPFPRIDDLAENYQHIRCKAPPNDFLNCHQAKRSLCEVLKTCGSQNMRPIPCFCVDIYGYEPPTSVNGKDFFEYCPKKK